ncbi:DUF6402 family protein [Helicobacter fennelliae]|uniref:DUF6402 family protein n=1 Tax=Helicobacter fennelliae TaxID=215 RepID=UPI000E11EB1C|nr:DUF6402 family protein [Helicobacter fennelliae]STP07478.1 Uncharacterised protein [Helicobacter fennelliae]
MSKTQNTQEYSKETIRIRIRDMQDNPIVNAKVRLIGIKNKTKYDIELDEKTNANGEVVFDSKEKLQENTQSFEIRISHQDYQAKPKDNYRRLCRSYEYGHLCHATFEHKLSNFAVQKVVIESDEFLLQDIRHSIKKNFYKTGNRVMLKAQYDENKVKPQEIKWGYKILNRGEQHIQKTGKVEGVKYILFSNARSYVPTNIPITDKITEPIQSNDEILQLLQTESIGFAIPDTQEWKNKSIAIFAYKHNPHWEVCQIIHTDDYPQIVIDGTLAETLRMQKDTSLTQGEQKFTKEMQTLNIQAKILGWGTSYLLQRLWHDNPKNPNDFVKQDRFAANKGLRYASSKDIVIDDDDLYEILSDFEEIKIQKLSFKQNAQDTMEYYAELDWDNLYLQFPMIKDLESKILGVRNDNGIYMQDKATHIITDNFKVEVKKFLQNTHQAQEIQKVFSDTSVQKQTFQVVMLLDKMQERANSLKDTFAFKDCFGIIPIDTNITKESSKAFIYNNQKVKLLIDCQPHEFARLHLQSYPLTDETFAKYMGVDMKEGATLSNYVKGFQTMRKSEQEFNQLLDNTPYAKSTIALYAITGKFSIYYLPHTFTIQRNTKQENLLECCIDSLLCYIYDSFDFSDQSYQPVGMWDYNEVKFNQYEAMQHLGLYKKHDFIDSLDEMLDIINKGYMMNKYYIINQNYQDYQTHFKFGLDYRIFSKSAKMIKILKNNHLITITLGV